MLQAVPIALRRAKLLAVGSARRNAPLREEGGDEGRRWGRWRSVAGRRWAEGQGTVQTWSYSTSVRRACCKSSRVIRLSSRGPSLHRLHRSTSRKLAGPRHQPTLISGGFDGFEGSRGAETEQRRHQDKGTPACLPAAQHQRSRPPGSPMSTRKSLRKAVAAAVLDSLALTLDEVRMV